MTFAPAICSDTAATSLSATAAAVATSAAAAAALGAAVARDKLPLQLLLQPFIHLILLSLLSPTDVAVFLTTKRGSPPDGVLSPTR